MIPLDQSAWRFYRGLSLQQGPTGFQSEQISFSLALSLGHCNRKPTGKWEGWMVLFLQLDYISHESRKNHSHNHVVPPPSFWDHRLGLHIRLHTARTRLSISHKSDLIRFIFGSGITGKHMCISASGKGKISFPPWNRTAVPGALFLLLILSSWNTAEGNCYFFLLTLCVCCLHLWKFVHNNTKVWFFYTRRGEKENGSNRRVDKERSKSQHFCYGIGPFRHQMIAERHTFECTQNFKNQLKSINQPIP